MFKTGVILSFLLLLSGCNVADSRSAECVKDSDCVPSGCSGQVCAPEGKDIITTCEYKEEYSCLKFTSCGCVNNKCEWDDTQEYNNCLEEVGY